MVVEEEMLQTASHTILLCALYVRHRHLTCKIWVLSHILEAASVERAACYCCTRTEHYVFLTIGELLTHLVAVEA